MPLQQAFAYLTGLAGLGVLWIVLWIATRRHPWALVIGTDGQPSTSKFQMLVWTAAVVFGYLAIYQIRFSSGYLEDLPDIPSNLLIAMGISVVTAVGAKSIAVSSQAKSDATANAATATAATAAATAANTVAAGLTPIAPPPPPPPPPPPSQSGIFADDTGTPDIGKVQVVLWTAIAVGVFLSKVYAVIHNPHFPPCDPKLGQAACNVGLPDIGQTLMILMGLGHGAYLGKKIAES